MPSILLQFINRKIKNFRTCQNDIFGLYLIELPVGFNDKKMKNKNQFVSLYSTKIKWTN
jgi:hypothetical protein